MEKETKLNDITSVQNSLISLLKELGPLQEQRCIEGISDEEKDRLDLHLLNLQIKIEELFLD